jgi:hypothetical protein
MNIRTNFHYVVSFLLLVSITSISCNKKNGTNKNPSFSWTIDGTTYVADDVTAYTNDIEATKTVGAEVKHVEIALHSVNDFPVGTYTIGPAADIIGTWNGSTPSGGLFSMSGTLHITASSPDEVSGNFNVVLSSGTGTVMTGTFSHVPLQ